MTSNNFDEPAWKAALAAGAKELGVTLDDAQLHTLWRYGELLRERNEQVNLTSIVSPEGILQLHMLDSLTVAAHMGNSQRIIDVGTGGGFPGIPLAVAFPDRQFTLIDGTQKKIRFVAESIATLGIANAQAHAARAESFGEKDFDRVVVRAVGSLADVLHNAGHLVSADGQLLAMKGRLSDEEIAGVPRGWHGEIFSLRVPGVEAERHLVALSRHKAGGRGGK